MARAHIPHAQIQEYLAVLARSFHDLTRPARWAACCTQPTAQLHEPIRRNGWHSLLVWRDRVAIRSAARSRRLNRWEVLAMRERLDSPDQRFFMLLASHKMHIR